MTTEPMEGWRESRDPAELAAAVAELGRKQVQFERPGDGWESTGCKTADGFADCLRLRYRYRLPADWQWEPETTGAERYLAERMEDPDYAAAHAESTGVLRDADLRERVARAIEDFEDLIGHLHLYTGDYERRKMTTEQRRLFDASVKRWSARLDDEPVDPHPVLAALTPPDGTEAVFLRPETVDQAAAGGGVVITTAARATQARRPQQTEFIPLNPSALGRILAANGREITGINITRGSTHKGRPPGWHIATGGTTDVVLPLDATHVEVLKASQ